MTLALFDLDNTLIGGDSDYLWGEFLVSQSLVDALQYKKRNEEFYRDYENGQLDAGAYLLFALEPLAKLDNKHLTELHQKFMQEFIEPIWLPEAEKLLEKHRTAGHKLVVITSTNRFIVEPIATRLGIDEIICSEPELIDGRYSGKFVGVPCFAEGKVSKMVDWLKGKNHSLIDTWFYSDSRNDLPLLEKVSKPIAVDPDAILRRQAELKGWPIISLR